MGALDEAYNCPIWLALNCPDFSPKRTVGFLLFWPEIRAFDYQSDSRILLVSIKEMISAAIILVFIILLEKTEIGLIIPVKCNP